MVCAQEQGKPNLGYFTSGLGGPSTLPTSSMHGFSSPGNKFLRFFGSEKLENNFSRRKSTSNHNFLQIYIMNYFYELREIFIILSENLKFHRQGRGVVFITDKQILMK